MSSGISKADQIAPDDGAGALTEIGRRLRDLRRRRSLTLQALSEESGVSIGMLSQMERGVSTPSIRTLQRVAEALEVPISWFFSDGPASSGAPPWVLRRSDRRTLALRTSGVTKELLAPAGGGRSNFSVSPSSLAARRGPHPTAMSARMPAW